MNEHQFAQLTSVRRELRHFCRDLDPDLASPIEAAATIESLARIEHLAAGARLRLAKRIDKTVTGPKDPAAWLAGATGQSPTQAAKDIETSEQLTDLDATDEAVRDGDLSPAQAHDVASAASADPGAEEELLDSARNESVPELRRKAKRV